ncbi:phosphotransferase enzyme family protein [Nocardiopsis tropica]|uniref:Phosphotransferase n=1 Tax=Nocardiopsis tropica TaxID=109330 RepID=A0ABU7KZF7_9ACTN|nr:phosphotransferase [Nocardiopsis umidischolae]MEE2054696.1 phosphotransferase [Nocardiopsis umidischolae]
MAPSGIASVVGEHYALEGADLVPVGGGADLNASLWRATDARGRRFAVKWSSGGSPAGLVLPAALNAVRPGSAPEPLPARTGALWVDTGGARLSVMEWVEGTSALETPPGPTGWRELGRLLAALHGVPLGDEALERVPREDFDPGRWAGLFERVDTALDAGPAEGTGRRLAELWSGNRAALREVHRRTIDLAARLRERDDLPGFAACHADPHLGNLVIATDGRPVLIDFDDAVLAPRERDLMFVLGGGVLADRAATEEQQDLFLDGYGHHRADAELLAYYRGLRVLEDASELAGTVIDPARGEEERREAFGHVRGVFSPTGLLAQALSE